MTTKLLGGICSLSIGKTFRVWLYDDGIKLE